jgi:hypothetical protein
MHKQYEWQATISAIVTLTRWLTPVKGDSNSKSNIRTGERVLEHVLNAN